MSLEFSDDGWSLVQRGYEADTMKAFEGLFTLGSERLHMRGSLAETLEAAPQDLRYHRDPANVTAEVFREQLSKVGTYVPGVYGNHPRLNTELINLPWALGLDVSIAGAPLSVEHAGCTGFVRTLDMKRGLLTRESTHTLPTGETVTRRCERFVTPEGVAVQRTTLESDAGSAGSIRVGIDTAPTTNGYDHFTTRTGEVRARGASVVLTTDREQTVDAHLSLLGLDGPDTERSETFFGARASVELEPGVPKVIEQRYAVGPVSSGPRDRVGALDGVDFESLLERTAAAWAERWATCDVEIEGDAGAQVAMRASLFHLIRAHPGVDTPLAIDAKGYAGEAYWGRFFWDTEAYLLPFYLYTDPARGRSLAGFRIASLAGAKRNAERTGYSGARFAWESDPAGDECCPNWQYADHEVHVTADVVYGLAHVAAVYGEANERWCSGAARELLIETGRYWLDRVDTRPGDGYPSVLGVMGPDEYTPISSNNAFTNRLVSFALACSAIAALDAGDADLAARCARVAESMKLPRSPDGELVLQCEEFERLAEPRFEDRWPDRAKPFASFVPQEVLYRSKCLKQADVLMLMVMFPGEFTDEEVRRAWEAYVPYTTHDSSLSAGAHMLCAQRLGMREEAQRYWEMGSGKDLNVAKGGAAEGVHIAACAATWSMAVQGFAGLHSVLETGTLTLDPALPEGWSRMRFPVVWRGDRVMIVLEREGARTRTTIENVSGSSVEAVVHGQREMIGAGERSVFGGVVRA